MKITILKDNHSISDFKSEKDALQWFAENEGVEIGYEPVEHIICAAVHYDNGIKYKFHEKFGIDTGFVIAGWRHPYICSILPFNPHFLKKMFDEDDKEAIQKYEELNIKYGWQEDEEHLTIEDMPAISKISHTQELKSKGQFNKAKRHLYNIHPST